MNILKWFLFPLALLYGSVTFFRNKLFDAKVFKTHSYSKPTIGVGNLSTGGTGKSVIVDYLITLLKKEQRLAVLSRGYKRKTKGFVLGDSTSSAQTLGDEPFQFLKKNPEIKVAVAEKRVVGMVKLQQLRPQLQVYVWDDVLQHRHVKPGLMILATTFDSPFYKDCVVPMGTLREWRKGYRRADLILVTKCPDSLAAQTTNAIRKKINLKEHQQLFFTKIAYASVLIGNGRTINLDALAGEKYLLVCGIANPKPLIGYLTALGHHFDTLIYPDHFHFDTKAIAVITKKSEGLHIVTTEKDYGRLAPLIPTATLFYLPITMDFIFPEQRLAFDKRIKVYVSKNKN